MSSRTFVATFVAGTLPSMEKMFGAAEGVVTERPTPTHAGTMNAGSRMEGKERFSVVH